MRCLPSYRWVRIAKEHHEGLSRSRIVYEVGECACRCRSDTAALVPCCNRQISRQSKVMGLAEGESRAPPSLRIEDPLLVCDHLSKSKADLGEERDACHRGDRRTDTLPSFSAEPDQVFGEILVWPLSEARRGGLAHGLDAGPVARATSDPSRRKTRRRLRPMASTAARRTSCSEVVEALKDRVDDRRIRAPGGQTEYLDCCCAQILVGCFDDMQGLVASAS